MLGIGCSVKSAAGSAASKSATTTLEQLCRKYFSIGGESLVIVGTGEMPGLLDTETLIATVRYSMYGGDEDCELARRGVEEQWARYVVLPNVDAFQAWWAVLIEDEKVGRLVIKNREDGTHIECFLRSGEFDQVLAEALAPLDKIYEREMQRSEHSPA